MKKQQEILLKSILYKELDPAFARRARILIEQLELTGNESVLEIGCGRGFYEMVLHTLYPEVSLCAVDTNDTYLALAKQRVPTKRVTFEHQDALHLPYKKDSFAAAFATEVLEHIPNDLAALKELHRVVKPGGVVVITVPHARYPVLWDPLNTVLERVFHTHVPKDIWWLAGIWADHQRLYTEQQLHQLAEHSGFTVEKVWRSTHASIPFAHFLLYGIGKNIVEKGILPSFNRFLIQEKPSLLLRIVRSVVYWFDRSNSDSELQGTSTVNLIVKLRKSSV